MFLKIFLVVLTTLSLSSCHLDNSGSGKKTSQEEAQSSEHYGSTQDTHINQASSLPQAARTVVRGQTSTQTQTQTTTRSARQKSTATKLSRNDFRRKIILDELHDFYKIYLYRAPDQPGLDFWSNHVFNKTITMAKAKELIKSSEEAKSVEEPAEYQQYPPPSAAQSSCMYRDYINGGVEKSLDSTEGYITRFMRQSGSSYPGKAFYKDQHSYYCVKQRIRCWAGQIRACPVKIKHILSKNSGCSEIVFRNKPESDRSYIRDLASDVEEIYQYCNDRAPSRQEYEQVITSVVEQKGTIYDMASFLCGW